MDTSKQGQMLGRDREFIVAKNALSSARRDTIPLLMRVQGEPGIGKSLFLEELAEDALAAKWFVVRVACHEIQRHVPFAVTDRLVVGAIRALGASAERYTSGLEEGLARFDASVAHLLGRSSEEVLPGRDQYEAIFQRLFDGIGADHSILFICDDAQWIDGQSATAITSLLTHSRGSKVAVVIAERPTGPDKIFMFPEPAVDIRLNLLKMNEAIDLAALRLPEASPAILETIAREAQGSPLAILAICDDVGQSGKGSDADHNFRHLFIKRILSLEPDEREFVQMCALLGEPIEYRILFRLYPKAPELARIMSESIQPYLVAEGPSLRFRHRLIADAVIESIDFDVPLRVRILEALAGLSDFEYSDYERIAENALACGDSTLASRNYRALMDLAFKRQAWNLVVSAAERFLSIHPPRKDEFVIFYSRYVAALRALDREPEANQLLKDALRSSELDGMVSGIGILAAMRISILWELERLEETGPLCWRYLNMLSDTHDRAAVAAVGMAIATSCHDARQYLELREIFDALDPDVGSYARGARNYAEAIYYSTQGDYQHAHRSISAAIGQGDLKQTAQQEFFAFADMLIDFREFGCQVAERRLPELLHKTRFGSQNIFYGVLFQAWVCMARGDWNAALALVEESYRNDMPLMRAAPLLAIPAMIGALTNSSSPFDEAITAAVRAVVQEDYRESAMQIGPWWLVRHNDALITGYLHRVIPQLVSEPARPASIGYLPWAFSLVPSFKHDLDVMRSAENSADRSRWALAHWTLARGIIADGTEAGELLDLAVRNFTVLDAPLYEAFAAMQMGHVSDDQAAMLERVGIRYSVRRSRSARSPASIGRPNGLTPREWQVAKLVGDGKSNRQIAEELVLSERTIEVHLSNIFGKMGFNSRANIVRWLFETTAAS